ncbi:hem peroxidase [Dillenia turbinata]|uniref:Hem peroxidase n=1 Tax=Dillenia turbinata TaxID=194707 RepID=A0AAN8UYF0_9MAGN
MNKKKADTIKDFLKLGETRLTKVEEIRRIAKKEKVHLGWHDAGTYDKNIENGLKEVGLMELGTSVGLVNAFKLLRPIKDKYSGVTYADLIQLASATAVEEAGGPKIIMDVSGPEQCPEERKLPDAGPPSPAEHLREVFYRMGLNYKASFIMLKSNSLIGGDCSSNPDMHM